MKAIIYQKFGPPEVLHVADVPKPTPKDNEVCVRIYATTVAAEDPGMRKHPGPHGIFKPRTKILGWYFAGDVEEIGSKVTKYKVGDKLYGSTRLKVGTYAQYKCLPEDGAIAFMPENLNYEEAAAIPNGTLTSIPFLRDNGKIQKGDRVLINGASGAVGVHGIQYAKYKGAEITAVCSSSNIELVKSLGADHAIDYIKEDFTKTEQKYDIIYDAVGKSSFTACKDLLTDRGIYLTTVPNPITFLRKIFGSKKSGFAATGIRSAEKQAADLMVAKELVEQGHIKPVIDNVYEMEEIAEAHRRVESGRKRGDVVVRVR